MTTKEICEVVVEEIRKEINAGTHVCDEYGACACLLIGLKNEPDAIRIVELAFGSFGPSSETVN